MKKRGFFIVPNYASIEYTLFIAVPQPLCGTFKNLPVFAQVYEYFFYITYTHIRFRCLLIESTCLLGYRVQKIVVKIRTMMLVSSMLFPDTEAETPNNFCPSRFSQVCPDFPFLQNADRYSVPRFTLHISFLGERKCGHT